MKIMQCDHCKYWDGSTCWWFGELSLLEKILAYLISCRKYKKRWWYQ